MDDTSICDRIIEHYQQSPNKIKGMVGVGANGAVDNRMKQSTEVLDWPPVLLNDYYGHLCDVVRLYKDAYPACASIYSWGVREGVNIQHYKPNEGYYAWHCERPHGLQPQVNRVLVFMTYLNEVAVGGETEFANQKIKTRAEKGLTLIWPVDWMFLHRGIAAPQQDKYICTGWFSLLNI